MRYTSIFNLLLLLFLLIVSKVNAYSWGFFAHEKINELSIYTLDEDLFGFYKKHVDDIIASSVDPDKRRYLIEGEGCKHYVDVDQYESEFPLDTLDWGYDSLVQVFGKEFVHEHGIAIWNLIWMKYKLIKAFTSKDAQTIVKTSAEIGHYVGDIHVPLHANSNYNGQKTNQVGIHALWESRLPEMYYDRYSLLTGSAHYIKDLPSSLLEVVGESHRLSWIVLSREKTVSQSIPSSERYTIEMRKGKSFKNYSKTYRKRYRNVLKGMVERRMKNSIHFVGSFWYSCWVEAGQPDLSNLIEQKSIENVKDSSNWKIPFAKIQGLKIFGRYEPH